MSNIQRKPPIKAKDYQRKANLAVSDNSFIGVEEVFSQELFLAPVNTSVSTFDGFFGEKPNQLSLTYELCNAYANLFIITSQYLWGPKSSASLLKTIQELMTLREFDDSQGEENHNNNQEEIKNKSNKIKTSKKKQILQKAGEELYRELENRETIHNNMLIGNLLGMVSS